MTPLARRVLAAVLPIVALAIGCEALPWLASLPAVDMTASRVVGPVALVTGHPIYAGPDGGPIIDYMYGPIGAVVFAPAALASSPSGALAIAWAINVVAFFAPVIWLHVRTVGGLVGVAAALGFVLVACRDPGLAFSAFTVHVDAPGLGLAACAWSLVTPPGRGRTSHVASALCVVLAVWTKQTLVPLVLALPFWLLVTDGLAAAARYVCWLVVSGLTVSAIMLAAFDPSAMFYNMFTLPARYPWYGEAEGGKLAGALVSAHLLAVRQLPTAAALGVLCVASWRGAGGLVAWVRREPWLLGVLLAVVMTPMAIVGGAKVGGYLNTHSVTSYFLVAATTLAAGTLAARPDGGRACIVLAAVLAALAGTSLLRPTTPATLARAATELVRWTDNPQQQAFRFARAHPGEIYLPWNPLSTLLAEGRLDNNEIGLWNREVSGLVVPDAQWRRYLPPHARYLAFRPPPDNFRRWLPLPNQRLPEFRKRVELPALPGWIVYERDAP